MDAITADVAQQIRAIYLAGRRRCGGFRKSSALAGERRGRSGKREAVGVDVVVAVVVAVMTRFPLIVSAGGVLIGYVAGDVALGDPALAPWIGANVSALDPAVPVASAALVVLTKSPLLLRSSLANRHLT